MKNSKNQMAAALVATLALAAGAAQAQTGVSSTTSVAYLWEFGTAQSPAMAAASGVPAAANITPGDFASGWLSSSPAYGVAQGIWDLGKSGAITLNLPTEPAAAAGGERAITVRVVQYQDGGIYDQLAKVTLAGGTLTGTETTHVSSTPLGEWTAVETRWQLAAATGSVSIVVTGAEVGSLIDQLTVEVSTSTTIPGPQLAIRQVGARLEISWPASYVQAVLESRTNLADATEWNTVTEPVQVKDGMRTVTVDPVGAARWYRLK